jgi:tetratricopeptide (TPR) repeat protein
MSDLLIGALSALLATNTPVALSNLVHARTGIAVPVTDPNDPVEMEYRRIMEMDDDAENEVDRWIKENHDLIAKGAAVDNSKLQARIRERWVPVIKAYESFLAAHPKHTRGRLAFGGFLSDIGEDSKALEQWDRARELDPANPVPWNNLANYYGHNGPITNAFVCYTKAIELKPRESLYYQNFATTVFLFRKDAMEHFQLTEPQVFQKAMALYRQARELDPDNFLLATDLAQSYAAMKPKQTGDSSVDRKAERKVADEALAAWRDAFKLAPDENARQGIYVHFIRWGIEGRRFDEARTNLNLLTNSAFASTKRALEKKLSKQEASETNAPPRVVAP